MRIVQDEKTGKVSCDFNPTENEIVDRLYDLVKDVSMIAKSFPRPQNEIMTLLDLVPGSLLPLGESVQSVCAADKLIETSRDAIKRVVASALSRPREILKEYLELAAHAFSSTSVEQFLNDWDERDPAPSMDELTRTVRAYYKTSSRALHDYYDVIYSSEKLSLSLFLSLFVSPLTHTLTHRYETKQRRRRTNIQGYDLETWCDARERG